MDRQLTYEQLEQKVKALDKKTKKLKQIEKNLKEKNSELNSFINSVPDMAWHKDRKSRFIAVNKTFCETVGMNPESLINQTCEVCFEKEAAKKFREDDQKVMKSTKRVKIEEKITDSQKNEIWLETIKSPIFDESGKVLGTVGIARDITHRKQAEKVLMESEKRYRAVVENQTEMICCFLPDATLTFVNEAYCRYFGKSSKELIGQNFLFLIPEDDRKKVLKNIASLNQNNPVITHEHKVIDPNGEICWHRWTNRAIFDDQNKLIEFQSVGWDITERIRTEKALMKSEERYRHLVETMNDGFGIQDEKGMITYVNSKFAHMLGYKPENLIGKPVTDFLDDRNKKIFKNEIAIRRKGKVSSYEIEWVCKDGKKIPAIMSPQAIFDEKGQFKGSFSVITDISILKQVEKELRQVHDELERRVAVRTRDLDIQKSNLEEANIALQVLLEKRQEDKKEFEDNVLTNVKELIEPYFEKIRKTKLNDQQKAILSIVESNLNEIISPFARKMSLKYLNLTPSEIHVANLIRHGINSKEIADIMSLSPRTIYNHRKNIRKKFRLANKKTNLRSHLLSIY